MNIVAVRKRKDCTEKRSEKINSKRARRIRGWHLKKRPVEKSRRFQKKFLFDGYEMDRIFHI